MELKEIVTLVAALIAAVVSTVSLVVNFWAQRLAELRVAQRKTLEPHVSDLGEALHSILASSSIYLKTKSAESAANWLENGAAAQASLKSLRVRLRYSLWGLDDGLRVLSRMPNWITHLRAEPARAEQLLAAGNTLREALDNCIRKCYREGRQPTWWERRSIREKAANCEHIFGARPEAEENLKGDPAPLLGEGLETTSLSDRDAAPFIESRLGTHDPVIETPKERGR